MTQAVTDRILEGKRIALTGRLAALTQSEAAELIESHGGRFEAAVTRRTDVLVIGQEGWPLKRDGRLTAKLERARRLREQGASIAIVSEAEFFGRLHIQPAPPDVHRVYTEVQLSQILDIPRDRIRAWIRHKFIEPVKTEAGIGYFDYRQVSGARTLCELARAGVSLDRVRKSLTQLATWLPELEQPLVQLGVLERDGRLMFRLPEGELAELSGQLNFDFSEEPAAVAAPPMTAGEYLHQGIQFEAAGQLAEAAESYRRALRTGSPSDIICFNLGNVLFRAGQKEAACERLYQAVELNPSFAEAWNNLGIVLSELGQADRAIRAFRQALAAAPDYADAHYNLADALEEAGQGLVAAKHWRQYVSLEPQGAWSDHARRRLAATS